MAVEIRKCLRCNHEWALRKKGEPVLCPKCKSPYWNRLRIIKKKV